MSDAVGLQLLKIAKGQLGYTEKSSGYTKFGNWYSKHVDHDPVYKTAAWCDMFVSWAAGKAGVADQVGEFAYVPNHAQWFKKHDAWGHKPVPGAIVFYSWSGSNSASDAQHIGLVEKVDGSEIHTIEANVDGTHLKRKVRDGSHVVGYGYPAEVELPKAVRTRHVKHTEPGRQAPSDEAAPEGQGHVPRHAAPPPSVHALSGDTAKTAAEANSAAPADGPPLPPQQAALTGLLAVVLFGSVALSVGKSIKVPTPPSVRLRKHGRHHRGVTPVALPEGVTATDLDETEAGTASMPLVTATVAAEAEDREFWGRVEDFTEDEELAFWSALHDTVSVAPASDTTQKSIFEPIY